MAYGMGVSLTATQSTHVRHTTGITRKVFSNKHNDTVHGSRSRARLLPTSRI
jgi:hypothetical protein